MSDLDFLKNIESYNGWFDNPDPRDITIYELSEVGGEVVTASTPPKYHLFNTPILNQGSIGACTVFGTSGALFETSYKDAESNGVPYNQPYNPWDVWAKAKERGASDTMGWSLQGALQLEHDLGHLVGYAKIANSGVADPDQLCRIIAMNKAVATGSAKWNWGAIGNAPYIYTEKATNSGHIYCLVGYDKEKQVFIARNSWTENWGDRGHFYIKFEDVKYLYSTYMLLDPSDADALREVKNIRAKRYADACQAKGVWNGQNPDAIATNEEIALMVNRCLDMMGYRTRAWTASLFEEKILKGKNLMPIWNGKDWDKKATQMDFAYMFTRAVLRDPQATSGKLTRFQVAAICGRDFLQV